MAIIAVGLIVISGIANTLFHAGGELDGLAASSYGKILFAKPRARGGNARPRRDQPLHDHAPACTNNVAPGASAARYGGASPWRLSWRSWSSAPRPFSGSPRHRTDRAGGRRDTLHRQESHYRTSTTSRSRNRRRPVTKLKRLPPSPIASVASSSRPMRRRSISHAFALLFVPLAAVSCGAARAEDGAINLPDIEIDTRDAGSAKRAAFDRARDTQILPKIGATSTTLDRHQIEALPQGENTPFDRLILQLPGVSADSAASHPDFHIRNEYSNVQYRINGLLLPDNVSGLGPILDSSFIGSLQLLTGTLPAQYGLRTSAVVDITTNDSSKAGGSVSLYGGSHGVIQPRLEYGAASGSTQVYINLSGFRSDVGIENPTPSFDPIHDRTEQGQGAGLPVADAERHGAFHADHRRVGKPLPDPEHPRLAAARRLRWPERQLAGAERERERYRRLQSRRAADVGRTARHAALRVHARYARGSLRTGCLQRPRLQRHFIRRRAAELARRSAGRRRLQARWPPDDPRRLRPDGASRPTTTVS